MAFGAEELLRLTLFTISTAPASPEAAKRRSARWPPRGGDDLIVRGRHLPTFLYRGRQRLLAQNLRGRLQALQDESGVRWAGEGRHDGFHVP